MLDAVVLAVALASPLLGALREFLLVKMIIC